MSGELGDRALLEICRRALDWARQRDYRGYSKHDALASPWLRAASLGNKWLRIAWIQAVTRSPVNLRPALGVRKARNAKGVALFARACLNLLRLTGETGYRDEAHRLLGWLVANNAPGFRGLGWGYPYPWQDLGFYAPAGFPNRIVTYFVGRALVDGWEVLEERRYLDAAERAVEFLLAEPRVLFENDEMKCLSYVPTPEIEMAVMDVSALCGALVAMVGRHAGRPELMAEARRLVAWVVDKQTAQGAWFYTHPPGDSPITHDNYHTGEILDAIADYADYSHDRRFDASYESGLAFYREHLFTDRARPKWMHDRTWPHDAHGYAQGIITFSRRGDLELARAIATAAVEDLWRGAEGRFAYQRRRFGTRSFTLMRWSQAWLSFALSYHLTMGRP